jgi:hypothetical protein
VIESVSGYKGEGRVREILGDESIAIPISIFSNDKLSALEAITKYLKEKRGLRYYEIAALLNRDDRTIWGAYNNAKQKMGEPFTVEDSELHIPIKLFKDRSLSVLEVIAEYMKEWLNLRYCHIARLLHRDDRTVWTAYNRAKIKRRTCRTT